MDGKLRDWQAFLEPDLTDLEALPRDSLKAGHHDVKHRLSKDIGRFCALNFVGMTQDRLNALYDDVKAQGGLELPLGDFEEKYARFKPEVLAGSPPYSTIRISSWGLGFEFLEMHFADDIVFYLKSSMDSAMQLEILKKKITQP